MSPSNLSISPLKACKSVFSVRLQSPCWFGPHCLPLSVKIRYVMEMDVFRADSRLEETIQWMYRISNIDLRFRACHVSSQVFLSNAPGSQPKHFDDGRTPALELIENPKARVTQYAEIPKKAPQTYYEPRICLEQVKTRLRYHRRIHFKVTLC